MEKTLSRLQGVIVAGVGGQGALTIARLILDAVWRSGYHAIQSEVHGMSQRGGSVNAQILFDTQSVTSPLIIEGSADLILGLEPLEALRYVQYLKKKGKMVVSTMPVKTIANYPDEQDLLSELNKIPGKVQVDTEHYIKKNGYRHAGNIVLLGAASLFLPVQEKIWKEILRQGFASKGDGIVNKNMEAFEFGRKMGD